MSRRLCGTCPKVNPKGEVICLPKYCTSNLQLSNTYLWKYKEAPAKLQVILVEAYIRLKFYDPAPYDSLLQEDPVEQRERKGKVKPMQKNYWLLYLYFFKHESTFGPFWE